MSEICSGAVSSTPDDSRRPRRCIQFWHVGAIVLLGLRWHWRAQLGRRIATLAAAGFVVYSVGRDGWDDGGAPPTPGYEGSDGNRDITFTVER